ncbi:MAG: hypothetical protein ORN27_05595, partial [Rhodoluna sp.]|nr:hypothetical protein [Rhodoluna sp.]
VLDVSGNLVANSNATVAVSSSVGNGAVLSGTKSIAATAGVVTFSDLKLTGAIGSYTFSYASTGLTGASESVTLKFGAATKVVATTTAAGFTNRVAFTTQPTAKIVDADNNVVTDSSAVITVSASTGNGAVLSGTASIAASNGVVNFSGLMLTGLVGDYTLTYASTGLPSDVQTITLLPGAATHLSIDQANSASVANAVIIGTQPKISVRDADENLVTTSTAQVDVALVGSGAVLGGTASKNAVSGVATFTGLKLTGTIGSYTLRFASTGLTGIDNAITLTFGAADHLGIETGAAGITNRVAFTTQPVISVLDVSGNRVTNSTNDVTVSPSTGNGAVLGGTKTVTPASGLSTFSGLKFTGLVGDYTLTYAATGLTGASETVTLRFGAATQLAIGTQPVGGNAAGDALTTQPIVKVQDADGNAVTNSTATVTVSVDADATGNVTEGTTSVAAVAGTATFTGVKFVGTPGNSYKLAFSSTGLTGVSSANISVTHAAASQLVVSSIGSARAGIAFGSQPTVTLKDRYGYTVTSGAASTASVTANSTNGTLNGTKVKQLVAGVATFSGLSIDGSVGSYTVSFTSDVPMFATSTSVNLTFGVADHLTITRQPVGGNKVGDALTTQPWVEVRDSNNNLVTDNTDTITLASNDSAGLVS